MTATRLMTADELLVLQPPDKDTELVRGRMVVREPPSAWHGIYAARLCTIVSVFVARHSLGVVFGQDTGFQIATGPDTVLGSDVAFVGASRIDALPERGFARLAPDLVAEIMSPGDRRKAVVRKINDWLDAGVRVAWLIEPRHRRATIFFADGSILSVPPVGVLTAGEVLPGFTCALREVFE